MQEPPKVVAVLSHGIEAGCLSKACTRLWQGPGSAGLSGWLSKLWSLFGSPV